MTSTPAAGERVLSHVTALVSGTEHHMSPPLQHLPPLIVVSAVFLLGLGMVERQNRLDSPNARDEPAGATRWAIIALLLAAAAAHIPVIPEHLVAAPYMGVLFICFTLAAFGLASILAARPSRPWYLMASGLCAAGVAAYVATRLIAFPQLSDDVGLWAEPLGLVSIATETAVVVLGLFVAQHSPRRASSSQRSLA